MYFIHPQIKFNIENLKKIFFSFFRKPNKRLLEKIKLMFPEKEIVFTDMGRTAFKLIVEEMKLQNSQILLPAYICDIFYPILKQYNISPVFLDIEKETFQSNPEEIRKKLTLQTKAILLCHTYGLPINIKKIREIIAEDRMFGTKQPIIIEDCAHSLGAKLNGIYTGNFGDAAFFSLYKQFPCLRGGMAVLPQTPEISLLKTCFSFRDFFSLLNNFELGAYLFKKFGGKIAPKVERKEKLEKISQINKVSLNLFLNYFKVFEKNIKERKKLALFFQKELEKLGFEVQKSDNNVFCYLSALAPKTINRDKLVKELRKQKIFCTRIWHTPIILNPEVQKEYNLNLNEFPNTIDAAQRIINFPLQNHYLKEDIEKIILKLRNL